MKIRAQNNPDYSPILMSYCDTVTRTVYNRTWLFLYGEDCKCHCCHNYRCFNIIDGSVDSVTETYLNNCEEECEKFQPIRDGRPSPKTVNTYIFFSLKKRELFLSTNIFSWIKKAISKLNLDESVAETNTVSSSLSQWDLNTGLL
jgi:hypothetical protein